MCRLLPVLQLKVFIKMMTIILFNHFINGIKHGNKSGYNSALSNVRMEITVGRYVLCLVLTDAKVDNTYNLRFTPAS